MSNIAETREFFFRHSKVNSGAKADKEAGYALTYPIGAKTVYNRFLKGDYPTQDVFEKLAISLCFKLNPEDTASTSQQGISKCATDTEVISGTSSWVDAMTRFVQVWQIPVVAADDTLHGTTDLPTDDRIAGIKVTTDTYDNTNGKKSKRFLIKRLAYMVKYFDDQTKTAITANETMRSIPIPLKAINTNGDTIKICAVIRVNNLVASTKTIDFYFGSQPIGQVGLDIGTEDQATIEIELTRVSAGTDSVINVKTTVRRGTIAGAGTAVWTAETFSFDKYTLTGVNLDTTIQNLLVKGTLDTVSDTITIRELSIETLRN